MTCDDCGSEMDEGDGRYICHSEDCYIPPMFKTCEATWANCQNFTTYESPFGYLCARHCFADNH